MTVANGLDSKLNSHAKYNDNCAKPLVKEKSLAGMSDIDNSNPQKPSTPDTASTGAVNGQHKPSTKSAQPASSVKDMGQNVVAGLIVERLNEALTYDPVTGNWYQRSGNIFESIADERVKQIVRKELEKRKINFNYGYLSGVCSFVRDDVSLFEWTSDQDLLPLKNGLLSLKTGRLRSYKKSDRFRTCLPIEHDVNADCPNTKAILKQIADNDEVYELIIACLYCILTRRYDLQKYIELLGQGGTGKSTLVDLFTKLVGEENRATTDLKELENNRFESASLYGKYLIVISDSCRYGGDVSKLKAITGGDPLRNEVKNKQQSKPFKAEGIVVIAANEPIQSKDYTTGLTRRRLPIYLTREVTAEDKAKYPQGVGSVFDAELAGLLNYLLSQDRAQMVERITNPSEFIEAGKLAAELSTNPLLQWADEYLVQVERGKESPVGGKPVEGKLPSPTQGLYSSYCDHCEQGNISPVTINSFSNLLEQQLQSRGIDTRRHKTNKCKLMLGLALRGIDDTDTPLLLSATK